MGKFPVKAQRVEQQKRVLAAGNADCDPVSRFDQPEILIRSAYASQCFLHIRNSLLPGYADTVMLCMTEKDCFILRGQTAVCFFR